MFNKADILRKVNTWKAYDTDGKLLTFESELDMRMWIENQLPDINIHWSGSPDVI